MHTFATSSLVLINPHEGAVHLINVKPLAKHSDDLWSQKSSNILPCVGEAAIIMHYFLRPITTNIEKILARDTMSCRLGQRFFSGGWTCVVVQTVPMVGDSLRNSGESFRILVDVFMTVCRLLVNLVSMLNFLLNNVGLVIGNVPLPSYWGVCVMYRKQSTISNSLRATSLYAVHCSMEVGQRIHEVREVSE